MSEKEWELGLVCIIEKIACFLKKKFKKKSAYQTKGIENAM